MQEVFDGRRLKAIVAHTKISCIA